MYEYELWLWANGYSIMQWKDFTALHTRAAQFKGRYILFDPNDDGEGFMLIMDDKADLVEQARKFLAA
jgi:hypothetical protein